MIECGDGGVLTPADAPQETSWIANMAKWTGGTAFPYRMLAMAVCLVGKKSDSLPG